MAQRNEPRIPDTILDQLLAGSHAQTAFDQGGLLHELSMPVFAPAAYRTPLPSLRAPASC
ncbi:hypothetical protein EAH89_28750 [Roseomonas nepalensis]|uniref:Uncharacterized protein n=1 Tax=Muricoccus nepalensis TaxID=1854500 RepID=A0A502EVA1_9PROT|nr:hypothetical protein EAH89_28750 [Roseomonas nepalensis]